MRKLGFILTLLAPFTTTAHAQIITGVATVIDGDTIQIHAQRIRLWGIDAPESGQLCLNSRGTRYRCGSWSANQLSLFLGQRTVTCERRNTDRNGRWVVVCRVGGRSVNQYTVQSGLAVAYRRYSLDYVGVEAGARARKLGLWAGTFQMPWEYRANPSNPATAGTPRTRPANPQPARPRVTPQAAYYPNCAAARAAGTAPMYRGQPGYRAGLDREGDGRVCER